MVIGAGPAGLFAALAAAESGLPVVLLERGADQLSAVHALGTAVRATAQKACRTGVTWQQNPLDVQGSRWRSAAVTSAP